MSTMYQDRKMKTPEIYPEHQEYWNAAAEGKLLIKCCEDCKEYHYYPRTFCPHCHSENISWKEANGTGTVYTYSVMRRGKPYAVAFVALDEGPKMLTNIVDCDLDTVHIEQKVQVVFKQSGDEQNPGVYIPCFTPVEG